MKFIKSSLAKKLIIVLITLLIFNVAYPTVLFAVDFGGILLQPVVWLILAVVVPIDAIFGMLINGEPTNHSPGAAAEVVLNKNQMTEPTDWVEFFFVGPDSIFATKVNKLNANIFDQIDRGDIMGKVANVVAQFYVLLRNICALLMLAGLIFTGIRILLSANIPTKKTQYLMLLQDWLIGMALLIFSHIIMILIFNISDALVDALGATLIGSGSLKWELVKKLAWSGDSAELLINFILYIYMLWLTLVFLVAYFKRFFWTCILVVFAPVFAVMYAFGQQTKQVYTQWLKEFILNVFVQPFHLIVYTVLVGIPMTLSHTDGWVWNNQSLWTKAYCLMAITMIRPAEKYMRGLFGMDKGIANMASYDSGKATFDAVKNTIEDVAKVGAAVATGGATLAATGGIGSSGGGGGGTTMPNIKENDTTALEEDTGDIFSESTTDLGDNPYVATDSYSNINGYSVGYDDPYLALPGDSGDMLDDGAQIADKIDEFAEKEKGSGQEQLNTANITIGSADVDMPTGEATGQSGEMISEGKVAQAGIPSELLEDTTKILNDPSLDLEDDEKEQYMQDPQKLAHDLPQLKRKLTKAIDDKGDIGNLVSKIDGAIGERFRNPTAIDVDDGYEGDPYADKRQRVRDLLSGTIKGKKNKEKFDFVTSHADDKELSALEEIGDMKSRRKLMDKVSSGLKDSGYYPPTFGGAKDTSEGSAKTGIPAGAQVSAGTPTGAQSNAGATTGAPSSAGTSSGSQGSSGGFSGGSINASNITINASSINLQGAMQGGIRTAETSALPDSTKETSSGEILVSKSQTNTKEDETIEIKGGKESLGDKISRYQDAGYFEDIGRALNAAYKGGHSISDTLYVNGAAPTDWKGVADRRDARIKESDTKRKERVEREKASWANDKANIKIMADKYMNDKSFTDSYSDKPEAYVRRKAEEKAKGALKDMSAYVQYGITDVNLAYKLYKDANAYSYSPEEAIRSRAGYEAFNGNVKNVNTLNVSTSFPQNNYTTVEQAIPHAREYYNAGYTNINEMAWLHYMADKLGKTPAFAMKIDEELKKKGGKINYNGANKELKNVIDQINNRYSS